MVDAAASNVAGRETVGVQIPRRAPSLEGDVRGASRCGRGGTGRRGGLKIRCPRGVSVQPRPPAPGRAADDGGIPCFQHGWNARPRADGRVAELVDALSSGGSSRKGVRVRVPPRPPARGRDRWMRPRGGIGRRAALRWLSGRPGGGSIPLVGTSGRSRLMMPAWRIWETRQFQVLVGEGPGRFDPCRRHHQSISGDVADLVDAPA